MTNVKDKVAVVTGAGSGIGRALAYDLARRGAKLALSDVDADGLAETVKQVQRHRRPGALGEASTSPTGPPCSRYADEVAAEFGVVNIVINNAGIAFTGDIEHMSFEQIERVMDVDFWGVVNGTKAFLPHLIASGDGHVVNISSPVRPAGGAGPERLQRGQVRGARLHRGAARRRCSPPATRSRSPACTPAASRPRSPATPAPSRATTPRRWPSSSTPSWPRPRRSRPPSRSCARCGGNRPRAVVGARRQGARRPRPPHRPRLPASRRRHGRTRHEVRRPAERPCRRVGDDAHEGHRLTWSR